MSWLVQGGRLSGNSEECSRVFAPSPLAPNVKAAYYVVDPRKKEKCQPVAPGHVGCDNKVGSYGAMVK